MPARYTSRVVTPFYRPPETCLQDPYYDERVDVWSTACVFAELLIKRPLFRGTSELDQLPCIFKIMLQDDQSMPKEDEWPEFRSLFERIYPNGSFPSFNASTGQLGQGSLRNYFANMPESEQSKVIDDEIISLLEFMLVICPKKRPSAEEVLAHPFFADCPESVDLDFAGLIEENKIVSTFV